MHSQSPRTTAVTSGVSANQSTAFPVPSQRNAAATGTASEPASDHLRNALQIIRCLRGLGGIIGALLNDRCVLDGLESRIQAALEQLPTTERYELTAAGAAEVGR